MSAKAVSTYYGRFPVRSLRLLLVPVDGPRVRGGTTWGYRGAAIRVLIGRASSEDDLKRDWVMVHEMVHTALPDMTQAYPAMSSPSSRATAGNAMTTAVTSKLVRNDAIAKSSAGIIDCADGPASLSAIFVGCVIVRLLVS